MIEFWEGGCEDASLRLQRVCRRVVEAAATGVQTRRCGCNGRADAPLQRCCNAGACARIPSMDIAVVSPVRHQHMLRGHASSDPCRLDGLMDT